ncbi:MAG: efflux RND transporter periplasmic adaptor subunit [Bdellovibrionia bacterium]
MDLSLLKDLKADLKPLLLKRKWPLLLASGGFLVSIAVMKTWLRPHHESHSQEASHAHGTRSIHLTADILKEYPISLSQLKEIEPSEEVLLPGRVQKDPTQTALVTARAQGRITQVKVQESDEVKVGQILAVIQSTEVAQAQSAHLKILLRFELAQRQMERSSELFEHQIVSAKEHELVVMEYNSVKTELEASRTTLKHLNISNADIKTLEKERSNLGELHIRSPLSGMVLARKAALGQSVTADEALFTIGKSDQFWIVLDVYEKDLPFLKEGMDAEILIPSHVGAPKVLGSKVVRIAQEIDASTRSVKVWLEAKTSDHDLRFGQAISARIQGIHHDRMNKKIFAVPFDSVHQIEGESILFVKLGELDFEARKVTTGWTSDKWIEILTGVKPGEEIVSTGSFILKSEFLRN